MKRPGLYLLLSALVLLLPAWTQPSSSQGAGQPRLTPDDPQRSGSETTLLPALPPGSLAAIDPSLLKQIAQGDDTPLRFIVEMAQQATLRSQGTRLEQAAQRASLVNSLQTTAQVSQSSIRNELDARTARGQVVQYRSFWILNGLSVTADADTLLALAARPDVQAIREDHWRKWVDDPSTSGEQTEAGPNSVEWNVSRVRADLAWSALGLDGRGVTVGIVDTGVDWQHPALQARYRGYKAGGLSIHEGNWFCTTDEGYLYPVDGFGHGTHVAGIAVGTQDATGQAIGVAPGARWIAVKTLNDTGYGYDSWIHAAFEWILAPAGNPALAPDVINGSWGAANGALETFRADLQALRAAGIVPVFATGNDGPDAPSVGSPASYPEAIAVGATDDLDQVASFSSRGPSPWGEIKPEVVAPGTQIRSSLPGGTYGIYNGTSMATPHVTGAVALMLQANPALSVEEIEAILTSTALPLGDQVPNNNTGWGRLDAYQAAAVALNAGTVTGRVTREPDLLPLPTAQITVYDDVGTPRGTVRADEIGHYRLSLPAGRYDLEFSAFGYKSKTAPGVTVQAAITTTMDLALGLSPSGVLWGSIHNASTGGPVGAGISAVGTPAQATSDEQTGTYSLALPAGRYTVDVAQNGYRRYSQAGVEIRAGQDMQLDIALTPAPTLLLVDSGRWYYGSQDKYFEQALDDDGFVYDLWEIRDLSTDVPSLDDLSPYEIIVWSSPEDAPGLIGAGDTISNYLSSGGNLLLSGQDIGFWDDGLSSFTWDPYYRRFLKAKVVADDAGRSDLVGVPDQILHGLSLPMNGPDSAHNQVSPDSIAVLDMREAAMIGNYAEDGGAALQAIGCQSYRAVYLAAGLEGLGDRAGRAEVMDRALTWLDSPPPAVDLELYPSRQDEIWLTGRSVTYTVELRNTGYLTDEFTLELSPSAWAGTTWDDTFSKPISKSDALGPCQTQTLGIQVTVPPSVSWNTSEVITLTARSKSDPGHMAQAAFHSKAPAPILLVDDHRWVDTSADYEDALAANGLPYDVWKTNLPQYGIDRAPSLQRLDRYRVVIWFTAYDWHRTLTPDDEARLAGYLDKGGRLLLSSQDYLYTSGLTDFARTYLGVVGYTEDMTVTQVVGAAGSPIAGGMGRSDLTYPFRNWSDALRFGPDARPAFWGQQGQPAALTMEQAPWKTGFFAFPIEAFHAEDRAKVVGQAVAWLSPLGDSSLSMEPPVAARGGELTCTLVIRNTGPALLSHVSLSNTVPLSTAYLPGSLQGPAQYDSIARRFHWQGALATGQAITVRYRLVMDSQIPEGTAVRNTARVSDESGLGHQLAAVSRVATPDLSASAKAVSTEAVRTGQVLTYTLAVRNDGLRSADAFLEDPTPAGASYLVDSAWASSGLLTSTSTSLLWRGSIPTGQAVTITVPAVVGSDVAGLYVLNHATLHDGQGTSYPLEAFSWAEAYFFLPLVLKQH